MPKKQKESPRRKKVGKPARTSNILLKQLVELTGLPGHLLKQEFKEILDRKQINLHEITLEQLRTVAASYLRQIMASLLERPHSKEHSH